LTTHRLDKHFPAHRHDFLEFSLVTGGAGYEIINGMPHRLQPGAFTLMLPHQIHEILPDADSTLLLYNCNFDMALLFDTQFDSGIHGLLGEDKPCTTPFVQFEGDEAKWMEQTIREMYMEYRGTSPWRNTLLRIKLMELLIRFDRYRRQADDGSLNTSSFPNTGSLLPAIRYIHEHYREEIKLQNIAAKLHISPSNLSKRFKKQIGRSFVDFLHEVRTRHACSLLMSTGMSISQISYEVGYGSYKTFSRVFYAMKGMTPTAFREANRGIAQ
jgi:AraC-like DNA-binding protein